MNANPGHSPQGPSTGTPPPSFPPGLGAALTGLARHAIGHKLGLPGRQPEFDPAVAAVMTAPGAAFVTLTLGGDLRGCIGSLLAHRPLVEDVASNAVAAAFRDPRFPALSPAEYEPLHIEVSVLSQPAPLAFTSQADALAKLRPGVDGVIFEAGWARSTFLPQVWEELPQPEVFMAHLKRKAGLPANYWGPDVELSLYTVTAFHEDR
ncbi:MAG: AmmeMemoRadiSam system protein A [Bifidobacteriaceae bacterium]|jgi:AmmeMemoRadiSam system protein A|nr:AmmeMemoRadiSam system protein A [Bifidobacteriaceae bacterium]